MKAISLWQPWASLIAWGWKTIETRTHDRLRSLVGGDVAIHAGLTWDREGARFLRGRLPREVLAREISSRGTMLGEALLDRGRWPRGMVLCVAAAVEHRRLTGADEAGAWCECAGLYGLVFRQVRRIIATAGLVGVPASGHQGIWSWQPPADMILQPIEAVNFLAATPKPAQAASRSWWND